ncbi:MAG TPA: NlpC/P60 family protein [Blastococcus sp.]|nr:NlpC/P60 family protein [Blastococcus sp.]
MPASRTPARPALSAREVAALQETLALRQALAARQAIPGAPIPARPTPPTGAVRTAAARKPAAAKPAARKPTARKPAARKPAARTATTRTPATRTAAGRTVATRRPVNRKAAQRRAREAAAAARAARRAAKAATRASWSTRLTVVALSTLLLPAAVALVLPGPDAPGAKGAHDVTALALTAQSTLLKSADRYRQLEAVAAGRRTELGRARAAQRSAAAQVAAERAVVGSTAADLYRAAPGASYAVPHLTAGNSPTGAVLRTAGVRRPAPTLTAALGRARAAETALVAATRRVTAAASAVSEATARADGVLAAARATTAGLSAAVATRLATLGTIPSAGAEKARNQQALRRWQGYLGRLAAAGITPPPAADLTGSSALPDGLSPALDPAGKPIPGMAWAVIGSRPVTVLPAETVAAVSNALAQLGKPYVSGATGPATYDCGGFTSANWLLAGYAVPTTPQAQWAAGAAVPLSGLETGDLVFSPGGRDVGIYLGDGDVLGASAGTFRVGIRGVAAGSHAVRVTLPSPAAPNAALTAAERTGACGAALPARHGVPTAAWGGWANGQIPGSALCSLGVAGHMLRCDAAAAYRQLSAAFASAFGTPLCITDSYRSYGAQVAAFLEKPALAAVPGTSNHGWALAVDLCGGINVAGTPQSNWMAANAGRFGFVHPEWAQPGAEKPEPWHWEYGYIS